VADRSTTDVGLGDLGHVDGALHAGGLAELLEHVLERQGVDDRGQHAHVVGLGAVHARSLTGHPRQMLPPPTTIAMSTSNSS
jgi:hypothetical protein